MTFVGLDIEATRNDTNARVLQLGLSFGFLPMEFPVRWYPSDLEHYGMWQSEAEAVHGISKESAWIKGPHDPNSYWALDRFLTQSVLMHYEPNSLIAVGFNVGSYDLAIVRRDLPRFGRMFHYRSLDLNSVMFMDAFRQHRNFKEYKDFVMAEAIKRLTERGVPEKRHSAGYDAEFAMTVKSILEEWR